MARVDAARLAGSDAGAIDGVEEACLAGSTYP